MAVGLTGKAIQPAQSKPAQSEPAQSKPVQSDLNGAE